MQRLTRSAPINDVTLKSYEETVAIIHRHLPPSLALLFATARQNSEGNLEWWTARQGVSAPLSSLSDAEQTAIQAKRQQYMDTIASLTEQLTARGETKSAYALQTLLTHSQTLPCYGVGGEPVLANWTLPPEVSPAMSPPEAGPRRHFPWLVLLLLLLLLLALAGWWFMKLKRESPALSVTTPTSAVADTPVPVKIELTQAKPSVNLAKGIDFGRITVNLNWQQGQNKKPVDLDVAAFIRLKNGRNTGVEALSQYFGEYDNAPFMLLKRDLRNGNSQDGEWLFINGSQWQQIDEVLIYSFIYGGAHSWNGLDATITISVPGQVPVASTVINRGQHNDVTAIARLKNVDGNIRVERLNDFFPNRETLAKHYGWNFEWTPGAHKN